MENRFLSIPSQYTTACMHALWHSHFLVLVELAQAKVQLGDADTGWKEDLLDRVLRDLESLTPTAPEGDPGKVKQLSQQVSDDARRAAHEVLGQAFDRVYRP